MCRASYAAAKPVLPPNDHDARPGFRARQRPKSGPGVMIVAEVGGGSASGGATGRPVVAAVRCRPAVGAAGTTVTLTVARRLGRYDGRRAGQHDRVAGRRDGDDVVVAGD